MFGTITGINCFLNILAVNPTINSYCEPLKRIAPAEDDVEPFSKSDRVFRD